MSSDGFRSAAAWISGSEKERAGFGEKLGEKWVIWNTDADTVKSAALHDFIEIEMMKIWVFG